MCTNPDRYILLIISGCIFQFIFILFQVTILGHHNFIWLQSIPNHERHWGWSLDLNNSEKAKGAYISYFILLTCRLLHATSYSSCCFSSSLPLNHPPITLRLGIFSSLAESSVFWFNGAEWVSTAGPAPVISPERWHRPRFLIRLDPCHTMSSPRVENNRLAERNSARLLSADRNYCTALLGNQSTIGVNVVSTLCSF